MNEPDKISEMPQQRAGSLPWAAPAIAVFWQSFGPYHQARLVAAQAAAQGWRVIGIEVSAQTSTYQWTKSTLKHEPVISLFKRVAAEQVPNWRIYFAMRRILQL